MYGERRDNMRLKWGKSRLHTKRVMMIAIMPILMIVCFFGVKKFYSHAEAVASELRPITYVSGGIENRREKQPFAVFNGQERKIAYLTFDDGPSRFLPEILDILHEYDVKATFFMIGNNLKKDSRHDDVRRAVNEGHYVGVHSMTHDFQRLYKEGYAVEEMLEAKEILYGITGTSPKLVRFPFGSYPGLNEELRDETIAAGLRTWDWTVDSLDWKYPNDGEKVLENVQSQIRRNREVILLHELAVTVEILPELISYLKEQGYELRAYCESRHFTVNKFNDERL